MRTESNKSFVRSIGWPIQNFKAEVGRTERNSRSRNAMAFSCAIDSYILDFAGGVNSSDRRIELPLYQPSVVSTIAATKSESSTVQMGNHADIWALVSHFGVCIFVGFSGGQYEQLFSFFSEISSD